jgi:hypothetical protein
MYYVTNSSAYGNVMWIEWSMCEPIAQKVVSSCGKFEKHCLSRCNSLSLVELSLSYGRWSVNQFVLVSGSPLGPMIRFYLYPFFNDNYFVVLPVGGPLWREDGSVTFSAIADWSGHWEPITIHYRLIWDCVPSPSPLTSHSDNGGGILTRLHTGFNSLPSCNDIYILRRIQTAESRETNFCLTIRLQEQLCYWSDNYEHAMLTVDFVTRLPIQLISPKFYYILGGGGGVLCAHLRSGRNILFWNLKWAPGIGFVTTPPPPTRR